MTTDLETFGRLIDKIDSKFLKLGKLDAQSVKLLMLDCAALLQDQVDAEQQEDLSQLRQIGPNFGPNETTNVILERIKQRRDSRGERNLNRTPISHFDEFIRVVSSKGSELTYKMNAPLISEIIYFLWEFGVPLNDVESVFDGHMISETSCDLNH